MKPRPIPFLAEGRELLKPRLDAQRPTFGICLGAQQIAATLGAKVAPSGIKEIGFASLTLTEAGRSAPLRDLADVPVPHWHGDTFAIPDGATHLAATPACRNQAFAIGPNILDVQFHPEADASAGLECWLIGHAAELSGAGLDPRCIRKDAARFGPTLRAAGQAVFTEWLEGVRR